MKDLKTLYEAWKEVGFKEGYHEALEDVKIKFRKLCVCDCLPEEKCSWCEDLEKLKNRKLQSSEEKTSLKRCYRCGSKIEFSFQRKLWECSNCRDWRNKNGEKLKTEVQHG